MYERMLVPLDGSNAGEIVLPYAAEIVAKSGMELILVSVSEVTADARDHLYNFYLDRIVEQVKQQLEDWGAEGEAKVRSQVLVGSPASEILRYADERNVSIIAMASRGRTGQGPGLLGNIAAKVLGATGKPVLLIRIPVDTAALEQRSLVKRILVPLDGSEVGEAALPYAVGLAQELDAEIVLYQVVKHVVLVAAEGATMSSAMYEEEERHRRASAMAYLEGIGKGVREKGLSTSNALGLGAPADQIIDYAEASAIDLIAMSTHGRSGITRWVFGSVTDKVLHAGNTPVFTVRATKDTAR